jgi:hypothetical protein
MPASSHHTKILINKFDRTAESKRTAVLARAAERRGRRDRTARLVVRSRKVKSMTIVNRSQFNNEGNAGADHEDRNQTASADTNVRLWG